MTMEHREKPLPVLDETPDAGEIGELSEEDIASICAAIDAAFARPARDDMARLSTELGPQLDAWFREQEAAQQQARGIDSGNHTERRPE